MKSRLVLITIISISTLASIITAAFAQGYIDPTDNKPKCGGSYSEDCGPGKKRDVNCGPNGEFETGECKSTGGGGGGGGDDEDDGRDCPVATIWDGSKCRGTAEGTDKETQDQEPCSGCSEKVAKRKDEPVEISRQEGNARRVSGPGGGGGGGTASPTGTPVVTSTIDGECPAGQAKCWSVGADSCEYRGCQATGSCTLLGTGFVESNERPSACTAESTTDLSVVPPSDIAVEDTNLVCERTCPSATITVSTRISSSRVQCESSGGGFAVESGQSVTCPDGTTVTAPDVSIVPVAVEPNNCSDISGMTISASSESADIFENENTCFDESLDSYVVYCQGHTDVPRGGVTIHQCNGGDEEADGDDGAGGGEEGSPLPICPSGAQSERSDTATVECLVDPNETETKWYCPGDIEGGRCVPEDSSEVDNTIAGVLGANTTSQDLDSGIYEISGPGITDVNLIITDENVSIVFFYDTNGDGLKQESEPVVESGSINVSISKVIESTTYNLNKGWNLLGFDLVSGNWSKASTLMDEFDRQEVFLTHISTYTGGKWQTFSRRADEAGNIVDFGDDFTIIPGRSYFIKAQDGGSITLTGNKFTQSVPLDLANGWNLVSVQSPTDYKASTFLNKCVSGSIQCDSIARFDSGLYEVVVSKGGTFFGNDFNLIKKSGYFLRVQSGGGQRLTP